MGDEDTDSQMMRRQQAMDIVETIPLDETHQRRAPSDSDVASADARAAAKAGQGGTGEWAEDAVLRQNRAALEGHVSDERRPSRGGAAPTGSLASPGRSLLGD